MKNILIALFIVLAIIGGIVAVIRLASGEDTWICDKGQWVEHGKPSAPRPTSGCGEAATQAAADFSETGHLTKDNPGLKPNTWYLVYEKPGAPALTAELDFTPESRCSYNGAEGTCPDILLPSSAMTHVQGVMSGDTVTVLTAVSP